MKATRIPPSSGAIGLVVVGLLLFGAFGVLVAVFGSVIWGILLAALCFGMASVYLYGLAFGGMGTYVSQDGIETRSAFGNARRVPWGDIKTIDVVWRGGIARLEYTRIVYGRGAEILFGPLQRDRSATAFAAYLEGYMPKRTDIPAEMSNTRVD